MWALAELNLAHERTDLAGAFGGNREPDYLAKNPNGLVPAIEDGDVMIWESNTIVRYLAAQYGKGSLEPAEIAARWRASQWMDWQLSVFGPALTPGFWQLIRTPQDKRDHKVVEASRNASLQAMGILDAQLARTAYLACDDFSMGDIPAAIFAMRVRALFPQETPTPHLDRWYDAIAQRPAYQAQVLAVPLT
jgi:glutathione S-transferase